MMKESITLREICLLLILLLSLIDGKYGFISSKLTRSIVRSSLKSTKIRNNSRVPTLTALTSKSNDEVVFEIAKICDIESRLLPMMKSYYMEDGNKEMDWNFSRRAVLSLASTNENEDDDDDDDNTGTILDNVYGSIWLLKTKQKDEENYVGYVCLCYSFSLE